MLSKMQSRLRQAHAGEEGLSLVEVLVAMTVLSVAVLGVAGTASSSLRTLRASRDRQVAVQHAAAAIEQARAFRYSELAINSSCSSFPASADPFVTAGDCSTTMHRFAHDGSQSEDIVFSATSGFNPYVTTAGRLTIRRYVTWFDDPRTTASARDAKRVTALVTWRDDGNGPLREVRQSTLIAEADRGLPVPEFTVSPLSRTQKAVIGNVSCFPHTLTNIGAADRYDLVLTGATLKTDTNGDVYEENSAPKWRMRAFLGASAEVEADIVAVYDGDSATVPSNGTLFDDTTGDLVPDFATQLGRGASATLTLCYNPRLPDGTVATGDKSFAPRIRSAFDSSVYRDLSHSVDVVSKVFDLYLHDDGNGSSTTWNPSTDVFAMNETAPAFTGSLPNYDTNRDGLPGLLLEKSNSPVPARWTHQFILGSSGSVTIGGTAELSLFTSWPNSISNSDTSDRTVAVRVTVERVNTTDATRNATLFTNTFTYTHATAGWVGNTFNLTLSSAGFGANDFLRLSLACPGASQVDCLLAHDTTTFPARLRVASP